MYSELHWNVLIREMRSHHVSFAKISSLTFDIILTDPFNAKDVTSDLGKKQRGLNRFNGKFVLRLLGSLSSLLRACCEEVPSLVLLLIFTCDRRKNFTLG